MKSSTKQPQASERQLVTFFLAILVIIGLTGGAWLWMEKQQTLIEEAQKTEPLTAEELVPTVTPRPREIPHGKTGFSISTTQTGPQMNQGFLDPYDPAQGGTQTIALQVSDTAPVERVSATIQTDTKTTNVDFRRVSGTDLSGEWQGTWTVNDTYLYTYVITFEARSANGTTTVPSTFR